MFSRTRFRLTAWYVGVMAAFIAVLGGGVYYVVQTQLRGQVDAGIKSVASRAAADVRADRGDCTRPDRDILQLRQGGLYKLSVICRPFGLALPVASGASPRFGLPDDAALGAALQNGSDLRSVRAPDGAVRIYSVKVWWRGSPVAVVQVARSTVPEHQSLEHLLAVLLIGGLGSLVIAGIGGWFLAGKSLRPVREAFERQHAFVADASHELRTPLAVIRANAEYLQSDNPDSVEIADIVSETDRLSALVDALLALARGEAGDRPPRDLFDLGTLVQQSADAMQPLADERGIDLAVEVPHGLHVQGDREQLRQLVVILVDNALRYTPPDGSVDVEVARSGDSADVIVRDTGIGIAAGAREKVFERFYRADEARNRDSGGAGLGLAIAKELVAEHNGRITVESTPGKGSTFTVRLPLAGKAKAESTTSV